MESVSGFVWIGRRKARVRAVRGITGTVATVVRGRAEPEEPGPPAPWRRVRDVVLLAHMGSATVPTRTPMARLGAEEVIAVPDGRDPPVVVV